MRGLLGRMTHPVPPGGVFSHRARIWFDELDALGVLHHSRFVYHLERAQKAMFAAVMGADTLDPEVAPDVYVLVRNLTLDYVAPVRGESVVEVRLRVNRVRAGGLTVGFEFRSEDGSVLHCRGERTVCRMDWRTHRPAMWSDLFVERYEAWRLAREVSVA